jgi:putative endonuclease
MISWREMRALWAEKRGHSARSTGERGERLAERFLRAKGWRFVARNWRSPRDQRDEIDLVFNDGAVLVFIEVKARAAGALVSGYHAINKRKKQALRRAADAYLRALAPGGRPSVFRFDVVEVLCRGGAGDEVRHFENVPLFDKYYAP